MPYSALFAVSGFGAYTILRPESGLHVLESPNDSKLFNRVIVRRYREEPSPLVRDAVRRWRTGRIDRVFAGDFDGVS